jgi:hypothetical protein
MEGLHNELDELHLFWSDAGNLIGCPCNLPTVSAFRNQFIGERPRAGPPLDAISQ